MREDLNVTYEQLADPGVIFAHYDGKLQVAAIEAAPPDLKRELLRLEEKLWAEGKLMAGRQSMRLILEDFKTDPQFQHLHLTHTNLTHKKRSSTLEAHTHLLSRLFWSCAVIISQDALCLTC